MPTIHSHRGGRRGGIAPRSEPRTNQTADKHDQDRSRQLDRLFYKILEGTWQPNNLQDAQRFIEAICNRSDKSDCIERLAASQSGQKALHKSLTLDTSSQFMNKWASQLLGLLSDSTLKIFCNGELVKQVLWVVVEPPIFWNAILKHVTDCSLETTAVEGFSWLLLQLITLPPVQSGPFRETACSILTDEFVEKSPSRTSKSLFQKAKSLVSQMSSTTDSAILAEHGPGGRHDNDFVNYRDINILPTKEELESSEQPFIRNASAMMAADPADRANDHLDNMFRLFREDMLEEMRDDIKYANNEKKKNKNSRRNLLLEGLTLRDIDCEASRNRHSCSLILQCATDILNMPNSTIDQRKKALKKMPGFLRHQSIGCIMVEKRPLAFAKVNRNEDRLALLQPCICLVVPNKDSLRQVFLAFTRGPVEFLQVPTPLFAYEPILKQLQKKVDIELDNDILAYSDSLSLSPFTPSKILQALELSEPGTDLQQLFGAEKQLILDKSQIEALSMALKFQVASIQGPPGTGKSFVGALLTHILLQNTDEKILVLAYTNHALDQFLEDLMDIGIASNSIIRLGSKGTARTLPLLLKNQTINPRFKTRTRWELINSEQAKLQVASEDVEQSFEDYLKGPADLQKVLLHIEFHDFDRNYFDAFLIPETEAGETLVGKAGKRIRETELLERWIRGKHPGLFHQNNHDPIVKDIWKMSQKSRFAKLEKWRKEIQDQNITALTNGIGKFNKIQETLGDLHKQDNGHLLKSKRVIGCTTTGSSMYTEEIQAAAPGIIIVEEAGEILESHIIASLGPSTQHLIQIGDHKQLRPKVKNYKLTVESGRGFDFNRSLFERLVLQGRAHCTLLKQHRMRPEISELIRHNYPKLQDAEGTKNRPHLRGFQRDVIFVNHSHPEARHNLLKDKLDENDLSSKQNGFEADMVLKCVRYLGQQGYRTADLVILTPYLGQLSLLKDRLSKDHDPVLSDFDSHDLLKAGLLPAASAKVNKDPIRLSTIDNYQGEESDIVVVSLTRSNDNGEIGFMRAPERLNVLISRARDALIMIGNAETFMNAKNGREEWTRLFDNLKQKGRIYDGFPLRCLKHPDTTITARNPADFDMHCPDGGCALPCSSYLSCGQHTCPQRCHILVDHSKMLCTAIVTDLCLQKHKISWECCQAKPACQECRMIDEERRQKARRAKQLEDARQAKQFAYARQLKDLQDQIADQQQKAKDRQEDSIRAATLEQQRKDLERLKQQNQKPNKPVEPRKKASVSSKPPNEPSGNQAPVPGPVRVPEANPGQTSHQTTPSESPQSEDIMPANCESDVPDDESNCEESGDVPFQKKDSPAERDWEHQKTFENASNEALDSLMSMIGLENVKEEFLRIKTKVDTVIRQGADLKDERFSAALLGNPGTGKTTVARLYAKFLSSVGAIPGDHFEETTGSRLANDGVKGCQALIDNILKEGGGVFFLDEAYQIVSGSSMGGKQVLDFLLAEIENLTGKVVFVFAGYRKEMEAFFAHNPGIPSRVPISLDFQDYEDEELLRIFNYQLKKKYNNRMKVEKGPEGCFMRIVARRIGRGRGREGFGNAREVQNVLSRLLRRQADRLQKARRSGQTPDDMLLTQLDLIGPPPSKALASNKDWKELQSMIGLKSVKQSVQVLIDRLQTNYDRELKEQPPIECSLNKCFIGNPGTGKTTVAKIYGGILAAIGLLSNGEVIIKNPADFVGNVLGQSEKNTKAILDSSKGKVLIIDEAYMLAGGGQTDIYKTAVIDTIVAEVQSTASEDRCVLLLGYKGPMEDMFRNVNPGLNRRFPIASGFHFEDYDSDELRKILDLKLKKQALRMGEKAKKVVLEVLERERHKPNFGNAGAVDIVLNEAKDRQQKRLSENPGTKGVDVLVAQDIDPDHDRGQNSSTNIRTLFKDVIGCEEIIQQLEGYQQVALNMRENGMDPREVIPFSFLFRGPPGTGKTSTARKMGKIYYDMGFLGEVAVVECSSTDIIGQYVGQTGPKVQAKFDEALGKVLFIDEAYRLAEGHFAKEAMDEIVDCLTKERFHRKLIVILAGYDNDINRLMAQNPGLTRRFPDSISFSNLLPHHCRDLLLQCLRQKQLDTSQLEASPSFDLKVLTKFEALCKTPSWGNAGDVQTLAKNIFSHLMKTKNAGKVVHETLVIESMAAMVKERIARGEAMAGSIMPTNSLPTPPILQQEPPRYTPPQTSISTKAEIISEEQENHSDSGDDSDSSEDPSSQPTSIRDVGVSDEVWAQLELDKAAEQQRHRDLEATRKEAAEMERKVQEQTRKLNAQPESDSAHLEALRELEAMRLKRDKVLADQKAKEERMRKELEMKMKIQKMGRCPMGFDWIEQSNGYRCSGGSHFLDKKQLGLLD